MSSGDFIEDFLAFTDGIPSPALFRLWSAIGCCAGAIERRIWVETARSKIFPNLYTLLVAPPGVGKTQAISPVMELWLAAKKFRVAPDNLTKAALVDAIGEADGKRVLGGTNLVEYHSLLVASSEFGVLVPAHDLEFLSVLNHIYDNPRTYRENRRTLNKNVEIVFPQLNILAGTQPGFMASLFPEEAWAMGFTARIIMVYAAASPYVSLFGRQEVRSDKPLIKHLERISSMYGGCTWTQEAQDEIERWNKAGCPPAPEHSKLSHYTARRILHTIKLCIISAVSRGAELLITLDDVNRAKGWLLEAEKVMPDIFREMVSKSDTQVIQELHFYMWQMWSKDKKALHVSKLIFFLQNRVPSEKVQKIIEVAEKSNMIAREAGTDFYTPRPKTTHGVE